MGKEMELNLQYPVPISNGSSLRERSMRSLEANNALASLSLDIGRSVLDIGY